MSGHSEGHRVRGEGRLRWQPYAGMVLVVLLTAGCAHHGKPGATSSGQHSSPQVAEQPGPSGSASPGSSPSATPSPPATRTPTAAAKPRTGKPGSGNTGVVPGTKLTVVNGNTTYSGTGTVVSGKDFHGFVTVTGTNVTFRNCVFRGGVASGNAALLDTEGGHNTLVEDSEFAPSHPAATVDDVWTNSTRIVRANIHGGVDGVKAGTSVTIQDSWIHDMTWFASDPNQGGGSTHNDGVQAFSSDHTITLQHNTIDLTGTNDANAALQNSAGDVHVDGNWLDGGGCTLNFAADGAALTTLYVTNNRFGRHSFYQCPILLSTQAQLAANSGNVWDDTGTPIPPVQQHD